MAKVLTTQEAVGTLIQLSVPGRASPILAEVALSGTPDPLSSLLFVDYSATPGGTGAIGAPFDTLQAALNAVAAGGAIVCIGRPALPEDVSVNTRCIVMAAWDLSATGNPQLGNVNVADGVRFAVDGLEHEQSSTITLASLGSPTTLEARNMPTLGNVVGTGVQNDVNLLNCLAFGSIALSGGPLVARQTILLGAVSVGAAGLSISLQDCILIGQNLTCTGAPGVAQVDGNTNYWFVLGGSAIVNGSKSVTTDLTP